MKREFKKKTREKFTYTFTLDDLVGEVTTLRCSYCGEFLYHYKAQPKRYWCENKNCSKQIDLKGFFLNIVFIEFVFFHNQSSQLIEATMKLDWANIRIRELFGKFWNTHPDCIVWQRKMEWDIAMSTRLWSFGNKHKLRKNWVR